jgi:hypothetical protein
MAMTMETQKMDQLAGLLELVCQQLELSGAQFDQARARYEYAGQWLAEGEHPWLKDIIIYPQGSVAIGTTVRPIGSNEHDVDLVAFNPSLSSRTPPAVLKQVIGERLRSNGHYRPLLEEKPRCWRLNYANEFHLDITPSISNPLCQADGELVPDRELSTWKATNPRGYRELFDRRAVLIPQIPSVADSSIRAKEASIEALPQPMPIRGMLRRIVQIAKRHRDIYFERFDSGLAPISIIVTTLASRSYEWCVSRYSYPDQMSFILDVLTRLPDFIDQHGFGGYRPWCIWNETTDGENFAEKWNADQRLAAAFFNWHRELLADIRSISQIEGLDAIAKRMKDSLGDYPVSRAMGSLMDDLSRARSRGRLSVVSTVGLAIDSPIGQKVQPNTFFGRK